MLPYSINLFGEKCMEIFNNLGVGKKIGLNTIIGVIFLLLDAGLAYYELNLVEKNYKSNLTTAKIAVVLEKTRESGLQSIAGLRGTILNPKDTQATANLIKAIKSFDDNMGKLRATKNISAGFENLILKNIMHL